MVRMTFKVLRALAWLLAFAVLPAKAADPLFEARVPVAARSIEARATDLKNRFGKIETGEATDGKSLAEI